MSRRVVGEIRKSQLINMFGVGSLIDLPHLSVIIRGLDKWNTSQAHELVEPRLLSVVRAKLPSVQKIRQIPDATDDTPKKDQFDAHGVPVSIFPRFLRCPACNIIGDANSGIFKLDTPAFQIDRIKFVHTACPKNHFVKNPPAAIPMRFMLACKNGHLEDFPFFDFVHRGGGCSRSPKEPKSNRQYFPGLTLTDEGVTGEASEVTVRCMECDMARPMADAFGEKADFGRKGCSGIHPHLGIRESCDLEPQATLLGSSNLYIPLTVSVLALPEETQITDVDAIIHENFAKLEVVNSLEVARAALVMLDISGVTAEELWNKLQEIRGANGDSNPNRLKESRQEEYKLLSLSTPDIESVRLSVQKKQYEGSDFKTQIKSISLVDRMTELSALVGFTRIDSAGDLSDYDSIDASRLVSLSKGKPQWTPGASNRGEGIFIEFNEEALLKWERNPLVVKRWEKMQRSLALFKKERPWITIEMPEARYVMLHTLSHMLMRELSISSGYASSSLKERIYCQSKTDELEAMSGILIYTASPDSEGTLGGLVSLGNVGNFEPLLHACFMRAKVCSSDPICSMREIDKESKLHGASCHSCSFVGETSCERFNNFLDRALVVSTFGLPNCSFFGDVV